MKDYCDTNILTAFVNKKNSKEVFGKNRYKSFDIKGWKNPNAEELSLNLEGCQINKDVLYRDIEGHNASAGAVLTYFKLKKIKFNSVDGFEKGKEIYNRACSKTPKDSKFYRHFCEDGRLKRNLRKNDENDIRHFGSAIKSNSERFITANKKDFKPLKRFTKIIIE